MLNLHDDKILILDFGSQYTQLIARRVRECGVYSEIYPWNVAPEITRRLRDRGYRGSIVTALLTLRVLDAQDDLAA